MRPSSSIEPPPIDNSLWAPPLDIYDVAVRLETAGVTDSVAREHYYFRDTLEFAEACFPELKFRKATGLPAAVPPFLFAEYLKGAAFGFPLLLCSLAMFLFRFSLWGGDVTAEMAAAVGLGTISSFLVTGGFVQAVARRCIFLLNVGESRVAERLCWRWVACAAAVLAASSAVLSGACTYFGWLPASEVPTLAGFHLSLGLLWLAFGLLHQMERTSLILSATSIGLVTVVGCYLGLHLPLPAAQIVGICLAAACALHSARSLLSARAATGVISAGQECLAFDLYIVWPYFLFGLLYYVFLFADRLLAWTVPDLNAVSPIVFRGDYETGMDIGLIAFVLSVAGVRPAVVSYFYRLQETLRTLRVTESGSFLRKMRRTYKIGSLSLGLGSLLISTIVGLGAAVGTRIQNPHIIHTMIGSLIASPCLAFGMWNCNLLFRLSRPREALFSMAAATGVDVISGYLVTRLVEYDFAIVGFAAGSIALGAVSCYLLNRCLDALDYHNFASSL